MTAVELVQIGIFDAIALGQLPKGVTGFDDVGFVILGVELGADAAGLRLFGGGARLG